MWKNITTMFVQRNITKKSVTTVETNEERKPATNSEDENKNLGFHSSQSDRDNLNNEVRDAIRNLALDEKKDENETKRSDVGDDIDERNEMRNEVANEGDDADEDADGAENGEENVGEEREKIGSFNYPIRPDAEDCSYYLRTGTCKFGLNCKFNHPVRKMILGAIQTVKEREELPERTGQPECKYYLRTGGCKFGNACRYNHSRAKSPAVTIPEFNFIGLPIRLGEKECPYYMRTGSCKYGTSCKFNHPDPIAVGGSDSPLQSTSQTTMASWSSPRSSSETASYVPMMYPPSQGIPPNPEWLAYQAPVYPSERTLHLPPTYLINNQPTETKVYTQQQQQIMVDEFPERPGQPECSYFLKTGDCKYRSGCKFHHPKNRIAQSNPCVLSDKGLPLRPDQSICSYYSRYGLCKFGPACKFDHPINHSPAMSGPHQSLPPSSGSFTNPNRTGMTAHENGNEALIQQPV
ncbi:Zinc finger, CCCH-type [Dillenia turbinata]|uniref:Zinc finger, CCCH-type n=1 Tax=Dillenia turbinata TaxID=194707 RepID=A0AAN8V722_9MAGN